MGGKSFNTAYCRHGLLAVVVVHDVLRPNRAMVLDHFCHHRSIWDLLCLQTPVGSGMAAVLS